MYSLVLYLVLLLYVLNSYVHCSYPLTIEDNRIPLPPYLYSTSTVVYNDAIYSYGGSQNANDPNGTDKMFSYKLDASTGQMVVQLENENQGPICKFCSAVLFPDSTEILVFSEPNYNETSYLFHNQSMWQPDQTVLPHFYDLKKKTWRVEQSPQMTGQDETIYSRYHSTTVMNGNDGVYVLGGYRNDSIYMANGWYYNRYNNSYTTMSLPTEDPYVDAIGYIDLDGKLALLGGCNQTMDHYTSCYDLKYINIYDNLTKVWTYKEAKLPPHKSYSVRAGAATQVDYDRKLLYLPDGYFAYGGTFYFVKQFLFLDLEKNTWITGSPDKNSENQIPHYYSSGALVMNNAYFVRLFGLSPGMKINSELNTVDVLNLTFSTSFNNQTNEEQIQPIKWVTSILENNNSSSKTKKSLYIGLIFTLVVALAVALLLFFKRKSLPKYWYQFRRALLWNPRKGEPLSTEMLRLLVKIIALAIIISLLVYNINDVVTSTISSSSSSKNVELITIPDFRICYSGWNFDSMGDAFQPDCTYLTSNEVAKCHLDLIESFYYVPHYPNQGDHVMKCYMFAPEDPVYVDRENATMRVKTHGYTHKNDEVIYMQLYRREENINRIIFKNETLPGITKDDVLNWSLNETQSDLQVNAFPDSFTTIEYQETDYKKIRNNSNWNYFGAFPNYNEYTHLSLDASQPIIPDRIVSNETDQYFYNTFTLVPKDFTRTTITEKRDSTLLHALGSIGGVISLLFALQIILFGTRPSSPWGIFHYWTWKKKSTLPDLGEQFRIEEAQVPFINPVHERFSDVFNKNSDQDKLMDASSSSSAPLISKDTIEDRVSRLEARNQLLELVMKNYYLDDQVFLTLKHSQKAHEEDLKPEKPN